MDAILTGEPIDARRAFDLGLVSRLVEPGAAQGEALRVARQIVAAAPLAVRASRHVVLLAAHEHDDTLMHVSQGAVGRAARVRGRGRRAARLRREARARVAGSLMRGGYVRRCAASDDSRRSAKWQERRDAIVDTSAQVFARRGYHATGIAELCEVNGFGKGAFYYYIGSKEELLAAIHDRVMDEVMLGADRVARAGGSPSTQLAMLGEELLDVIHRYPDHVWVFLHEFPALTAERADQFRTRRREYERRIEAVLQAGIDSGEFRDVEPWLTARAWLGMHNYTYLWLKAGGRVSARDVAKPFADIFLRGIGRPVD